MRRRSKKTGRKKKAIPEESAPGGAAAEATRRMWAAAGICALLVILVFGVFGQTLQFGFVNFDDDANVVDSPEITAGISVRGIEWAFTHAQVERWAPMSILSRQIDCQIHGLWAGGHHLTNVLLQASASVLLFLVLVEMTGALWRSGFVAAVFALHPLHVECVAWVSARGELLCAVFFMLSLWSYARYARAPGRRFHYAMSILWFALGLMSKSTIVTLPVILLLLDYWPLGRLREKARLRQLLIEKTPYLVLSVASSVASVMAQRGGISKESHYSLILRAGNALVSYVIYLEKTIFPVRLAVLYPLPPNGWPAWQVAGAVVILAGVTWGVVHLRRRQPFLVMGWLWYLVMLVPVIGIVQAGDQAYADRYAYLQQIGLLVAGTWCAANCAQDLRHGRLVLGVTGGAILSLLMVMAYQQTTYWRDSVTLWRHTLGCTANNYTAHNNFGNALLDLGRTDEAAAQYREAVRINPSDPDARANLAQVMFKQGDAGEAIAQYQEALRIDPSSTTIRVHYGMDLFRLRRVEEAADQFRQALRIDPDDANAHVCLGNVLLSQGQPEQAIGEYSTALRIDPAEGLAAANLGHALLVLLQQGRAGEAIADGEKALALQPGDSGIQNALAWLLATAPQAALRDGARAVQLATQAAGSSGGKDPVTLRTLAAAYAEAGQFSDAIRSAQSALQLARGQSNNNLVNALSRELELYSAGRAFHWND
jgi:tetratricopeptide (TPR) repeat protein